MFPSRTPESRVWSVRTLAEAAAGSPLGRTVGAHLYLGAARLVAAHLVRIPRVAAVYATGSLLGLDTLSPGQSDIDLSVMMDPRSTAEEHAARLELARAHRRLLVLGSMFHGLDPVALQVLPLQRAFGPATSIELDHLGLCLAGRRLWTRPAIRPAREVALEGYTQAVRRWVNGSSLILDPGARLSPFTRARSARKLLLDVAAGFVGAPRHRPLHVLLPELAARGVATHAITDGAAPEAVLGVAFDVLGRYATRIVGKGSVLAPQDEEVPPPGTSELEHMARGMLGGPLVSLTAYRRAPALDDWVLTVLSSPDADPAVVVSTFASRWARTAGIAEGLRSAYRRPVVLPSAAWRAATFLDPAPFAGVAATRAPSWGTPLPAIIEPDGDDLTALVRARAVESFSLQANLGFRGRPDTARFARDATRRHGRLVPALRAALLRGDLASGPALTSEPPPEQGEEHVARMRSWRDEVVSILGAPAAERLHGA